jgi:hypothetical protein
MARRPSLANEDILNQEDVKRLAHNLSLMSEGGVRDLYERAYVECRITARDFPCARAVQQLVTAWKQLRKWRRR